MNAWISPGPSRWKSFFCPSTTTASFRTRCGTSSKRCTGLPEAHEPRQQQRPPAEEHHRRSEDDGESERGDGGLHQAGGGEASPRP